MSTSLRKTAWFIIAVVPVGVGAVSASLTHQSGRSAALSGLVGLHLAVACALALGVQTVAFLALWESERAARASRSQRLALLAALWASVILGFLIVFQAATIRGG
jgi:Na+/H+-dicarboxylate symporter